MVFYRLDLDQGKLQQVGIDRARRLVVDTTRQTFNRSLILCPVDTGRLRASGTQRVGQRGAVVWGEIIYNTEYATAVHDGRGPITIRPRNRKALRFEINGQVVFARVVRQPARPGRPWLGMALWETAVPAGFRVTLG